MFSNIQHFITSLAFVSLLSSGAALPSKQLRARAVSSNDGLTIQLPNSTTQVQGFINSTAPNVRQFLGVPYAAPPVGDLRFAPPSAPLYLNNNTASINATTFPPSCMQQYSNGSTIYTAQVTQYLINGGTSEDCLYVSIWTPSLATIENLQTPLPVFLYIPGGGFTSGGQNSLYKIPDQWIERTQSHIVVIMNYRVNLFGYPNARGLTDLNVGLLDQRMAVEWTSKNIAAFGGDPSRIILWGQSAGGASVDTYGYSYPKDPIVAGLIADSGSASLLGSVDYAQSNFTFLAGLVGCGNLNASAELSCMRKVPAQTLEDTLSHYTINGTKPAISFVPIPDNKTDFSNTTDRALRGLVANIPLLTGSNTNEGAGFVPFTTQGPNASVLFSATQNIIACPVAKEVQNRNRVGLPTYRYQYTGNFTNISPLPWFGAYHSSELPLLFGTHYEYRGNSTPFEYNVSHAMEALWLSFASNPSGGPKRWTPANGLFNWPEYQQNSSSMVLFAADNKVIQLVSGSRIDANCTNL